MDLSNRLEFYENHIDLNFEINTDNLPPVPIQGVFLDFMETFSVADIFMVQVEDI